MEFSQGVILFAHGSRDPLWRGPIEAVASLIRQTSPGTPVECAYLELCEPNLPHAVQMLVKQGALHIRLLPVFFGMGKHTREDLPDILRELKQAHPGVHFELLRPAGEHPEITTLLARLALDQTA